MWYGMCGMVFLLVFCGFYCIDFFGMDIKFFVIKILAPEANIKKHTKIIGFMIDRRPVYNHGLQTRRGYSYSGRALLCSLLINTIILYSYRGGMFTFWQVSAESENRPSVPSTPNSNFHNTIPKHHLQITKIIRKSLRKTSLYKPQPRHQNNP